MSGSEVPDERPSDPPPAQSRRRRRRRTCEMRRRFTRLIRSRFRCQARYRNRFLSASRILRGRVWFQHRRQASRVRPEMTAPEVHCVNLLAPGWIVPMFLEPHVFRPIHPIGGLVGQSSWWRFSVYESQRIEHQNFYDGWALANSIRPICFRN